MFTFLLILQTIVAALMVVVILMQRSEGGGLGVGGSPTGLMSARGAADFLTRATTVLATLFIVLCIVLAGFGSYERTPTQIDPNLARTAPARQPLAPAAPTGAPVADPLAGAAQQVPAAKAPPPASNGSVPLAQ
jgi:preprotein translocase subunit SecG